MANFQWERLAMALGAVGAMQLAWERTVAFARSGTHSDARCRAIRRSGTGSSTSPRPLTHAAA